MPPDQIKDNAKSNYLALLKKIDDKFAEINGRHKASMRCGKGCSSCCVRNLTVNDIEKASIAEFLTKNPQKIAAIQETGQPKSSAFCEFLDDHGICLIYDARPAVCRSHGVPIKWTDNDTKTNFLDSCPLNFTDQDPTPLLKVKDADSIDTETLNTLLTLINAQFRGDNDMTRNPLSLRGILDTDP